MTVAIVGIGLIGGSIALSLKDYSFAQHIIGVSRRPETAQKALDLGLVDEILPLEEAVKKSDIIIVATPVDSYMTILPQVLDMVDNQIVIEVGSTKKLVVESVKSHPKRANFVATHPMAGTEYSGPEAAIHELFKNKLCVLCDIEESDPFNVKIIENLFYLFNVFFMIFQINLYEICSMYNFFSFYHFLSYGVSLSTSLG